MKNRYFGGQYGILTENDIIQIHEASMKLLWEVGFEINCGSALHLLEGEGAKVDWGKGRVYVPRDVVTRLISYAPSEFTFYGLEKGKEIVLGGKEVHFGTGGVALDVVEANGNKRPTNLQDIISLAKLTDNLEHISYYIIPAYPYDVDINDLDINSYYHAIKNTGKPVMGSVFSIDGIDRVIDFCSMVAGNEIQLQERPFVGFIVSITSPLKIEGYRAETLIEVAERGLPLAPSAAPIMGATSPITMAGTLVQQNAESLFGVILAQAVNPGTPVLYSAVPCYMNMKNGSFLIGSVYSGMMNAAITQMAHYYRIPCYTTAGITDSKIPDAQAGYESAITCLSSALAGGNFIHLATGMLEGGLSISYGKYVIDNDIAGKCLEFLKGINITPDYIGIEAIKNVVNYGGDFMGQKHTLQYLRSCNTFNPQASNYQDYKTWVKNGMEDAWTRSEKIAEDILISKPNNSYIPPNIDVQVRRYFTEIRGEKNGIETVRRCF